MNLVELRDFLDKYFNDDELRGLCFELNIPYEDLGASTKSGKARELVAYCQRRTRLVELEAACRRLRPTAFEDGRTASAESPSTAPKTEGQAAGTVNTQSGGVTINAQTVNITGDVIGRDKKSSSGSDSDPSSASA